MSLRLQIILLIFFGAVFLFLVNQVRQKAIELKYTLSWLLLDLTLIILTCFPNLLQIITNTLGITSPMNMIFFCGFVLSLIIIYTLTIALSRNSDRIRNLTQIIALNEYSALQSGQQKQISPNRGIGNE